MEHDKLEKLHCILLELMDEINRICVKHDIPYFLDSGSALGAVRHGGFIPWDDDLDIGMLRKDYDRFIAVAPNELSNLYFLQVKSTDSAYTKFNAKLRKNNTYFPERINADSSIHQGIFVDIYPFDDTSDDKETAIKETNQARKLYRLLRFRETSVASESLLKKAIRSLLRIIPQTTLNRQYIDHCKKYNAKGTNTITCYSYRMCASHYLFFQKDRMIPTHEIIFENRSFQIMKEVHSYLTTMYGDYMQLPPEEKRVSHISGGIRFE